MRLNWLFPKICVVVLASPLLAYAYLGFFSRYLADDYWFAQTLISKGFVAMQTIIYTGYSGRFSANFVMGLAGLVGPRLVPFMPAAIMMVWLVVLAWVFSQMPPVVRLRHPYLAAMLLAELVLFLSLDRTPSIMTSLFWQTGAVSYIFPLVVFSIYPGIVALWCRRWGTARLSPLPWLAAGAGVTFIAAGFSETNAVVQTAALAMAVGISATAAPSSIKRRLLPMLISGLIGSTLAALIIALAPGNKVRALSESLHRPDFLLAIVASLRYASRFAGGAVVKHAPAMALALAGGAWLASLADRSVQTSGDFGGGSGNAPAIARLILLTGAGGGTLIVLSYFPFVYLFVGGSPPLRLLVIPAFILAMTTLAIGYLVGDAVKEMYIPSARGRSVFRASTYLVVILLLVSPMAAARHTLALVPEARAYAERWDVRDQEIRSAVLRGASRLTVPTLLSIGGGDLGDVEDLAPPVQSWAKKWWLNESVAQYYGLQAIWPRTRTVAGARIADVNSSTHSVTLTDGRSYALAGRVDIRLNNQSATLSEVQTGRIADLLIFDGTNVVYQVNLVTP